MLGVWLAGVPPVPMPSAMAGMPHSAAPAQASAGHRGQVAPMCDRSASSDRCGHCGAGACPTMQGCGIAGCLVLCQASAAAARSPAGACGASFTARVLWRTRSLSPPTPPPLAIHDRLA
jgi:hypothetical protein